MHAGAGLGDDALLAHAPRQQDLADAVVDLVRAGVIELFALEVNLRAATGLGQAFGEIQRGRAANVVALEVGEFLGELGVLLGFFILGGQLVDQRHQGFGDVLTAEVAEQALGVRAATE